MKPFARREKEPLVPIKVVSVFGTRPEAIKMAPVVKRLESDERFISRLVATAQHRELLDQVLQTFGLHPDYDFDIMEQGQTLDQVTIRILSGMTEVLRDERPDALLVHGDTTSTFAAALAAFYLNIPVGHVEAGMRTGDVRQPFPEELNRLLTARLATWHFAPSKECKDNLLREGVPVRAVIQTPHNSVVDALLLARDIARERFGSARENNELLSSLPASVHQENLLKILVTAHRRESWGRPMQEIFSALAQVADEVPRVHITVISHANPQLQQLAHRVFDTHPRVEVIPPQDYLHFVHLMSESDLIATDSGGIQEEGPTLGIPVIVLRNKTEYHELVEAGVVQVAGTQQEGIVKTIRRALTDEDLRHRSQRFAHTREQADSISPILEALAAAETEGIGQGRTRAADSSGKLPQ